MDVSTTLKGWGLSASCGSFSDNTTGSEVDVTNLSVSFTCDGRTPVRIQVIPDGTTSEATLGGLGASNFNIAVRIYRDSTVVGRTTFSGYDNGRIPSSSICTIDNPSAGTYTYKVTLDLTGGSQSFLFNSKLLVSNL